jgi:hypothetical protein
MNILQGRQQTCCLPFSVKHQYYDFVFRKTIQYMQ